MSKIYTKTGDRGTTSLLDGTRVSKDHLRVECYGDLDELLSAMGLAEALLDERQASLAPALRRIEEELMAASALVATADETIQARLPQVPEEATIRLERDMDRMDETLPPLSSFVLPGGTMAAAQLHVARTICRRAERRLVQLAQSEPVSQQVRVYVNRLSDWCFTAARYANHLAGVPTPLWDGKGSTGGTKKEG